MNHALGHCIHYEPQDFCAPAGHRASGRCAAGVEYRTVRIEPPIRQPTSLPVILPCLRDARGVEGADRCPLRVWPTPEQVAEAERETDRALEAIDKGLCPECGANLLRNTRPTGGYTEHCPNCPAVSVRACTRGDMS